MLTQSNGMTSIKMTLIPITNLVVCPANIAVCPAMFAGNIFEKNRAVGRIQQLNLLKSLNEVLRCKTFFYCQTVSR